MFSTLAKHFGMIYGVLGSLALWLAAFAWFRGERPGDMIAALLDTLGASADPVREVVRWLTDLHRGFPELAGIWGLLLIGCVMLTAGTSHISAQYSRAGVTAGFVLLVAFQLGLSLWWVVIAVALRLVMAKISEFTADRDSDALSLPEVAEGFGIGLGVALIGVFAPVLWAVGEIRGRAQ